MNVCNEVVGKPKMNVSKGIDMRSVQINKGYSLMELMITVAIVGLLASVAYPSYTNFIANSNRGAGQADLMALAAAMERHKAAAFTYNGAAEGGGNTGSPAVFRDYSPSSEPEADKKYDLTIDSVSATGTSYVLRARPVSGTVQAGDGDLFYFSDGRKAWDQNGNGNLTSSEFCWAC